MKYILTAGLIYFLSAFSVTAVAQSNGNRPFFARYFPDFDFENAYIKIDDKEATYNDLLQTQDSTMLKVELYRKKQAVKQFGKDIGKNGVVLFTTKKIKDKPVITATEDSMLYYQLQGYNVSIKGIIYPTLNGDTTYKAWVKFLQKNLHANVPTDAGAPIGLYKVMVRFVVNKDGSVSDISVSEDPGYNTKNEALRVMSLSPAWQPGTLKGEPVRCAQREPITFFVTDN